MGSLDLKLKKLHFWEKTKWPPETLHPASEKLIKQKSLVPMSYTLSVPKLLLQINSYEKLIKAKKLFKANLNCFVLISTLKHSLGSGSHNIYNQTNKLKILKSNKQITQAPLYTFYSRPVA